MRPVIKSTKHIVQFPINVIATGTVSVTTLIIAVNGPAANLATEVVEGAIVKAVYIELWLQNQTNLGTSIVTVIKRSNNQLGMNFTDMAAMFTFPEKKNIFFSHEGLTSNDGISGPVNIMRGWIKIPKSKQRFGLGDTLAITVSNVSANDLNECGFCIYKEYT